MQYHCILHYFLSDKSRTVLYVYHAGYTTHHRARIPEYTYYIIFKYVRMYVSVGYAGKVFTLLTVLQVYTM